MKSRINIPVDLDADTILIGDERQKSSERIKTQRLIYNSKKGLCVNEAYIGYIAGHPVHHEYPLDARHV